MVYFKEQPGCPATMWTTVQLPKQSGSKARALIARLRTWQHRATKVQAAISRSRYGYVGFEAIGAEIVHGAMWNDRTTLYHWRTDALSLASNCKPSSIETSPIRLAYACTLPRRLGNITRIDRPVPHILAYLAWVFFAELH
jgi:hypothetical protein